MSSAADNLSLVLYPTKELKLENRPVPVPKDNEVLISIHCTGVCCTDIHLWSWGRVANINVETPTVIGHESSGTVVQVGKNVKKFKIGDRVVIDTSDPCLDCNRCLEGNYHLCASIKCLGLPPVHGTYARYVTHPAVFCHKIPDNMSYEEGALIEPLSVTVHACRRGKVTGGDKILICGAGTIGVLTMLTARSMGATKICVTDIRQDRLDFAKKLGADHVLLADPDSNICAQRVRELLGDFPDVSLDCCGFEATLRVAMKATKPRGAVVVIGIGPGEAKLPIAETMYKEIDLIGVNRFPNCYPRAIDLVASGAINVKPLITHRFKLEQAIEALKLLKEEKPGTVKVMIHCQKS
ncbi:sorbitol dehydrogenase-like [Centruroides sculpturatus]|uniref:sorbitol dehydrogenase-like n=1 Tax=Centruroides sculpturatus TaxID=218467 RepID=UPI000C6D37F0|nr:sorbitol dehydrogenase-like [Centruroides sculpturatus]